MMFIDILRSAIRRFLPAEVSEAERVFIAFG